MMARRGEMDAMLLPYIGTRSTAALHATIGWLLWLVKWGFGASIVVGSVVAGARGQARRGVRLAIRLLPLTACVVALLVLTQGLWHVVFYRPASVAASMEVAFVVTKLAILYVLATLIAALVLKVYQRSLGA